MNEWSSRIYRLMLSAAILLVALSPTPSMASGTGTRTRSDLNRMVPNVRYSHRPFGSDQNAIAPSRLLASTDARPVAEVTDSAAPAESLALDLDNRADAREMQATATFTRSLALDGSGDYVGVSHDAALNLDDASGFTIEAWVRRSEASRQEAIIGKNRISSYWLGFGGEKVTFYSGGSGTWQDGNSSVPADVWTHIAVVWASGSYRRYYINGVLDYTGTPGSGPSANTEPVYIGSDPWLPSSDYFSGNIAEVRVWNEARTQDEIRRTMHIALEEPLPGLVANWHLTDDLDDNIGGHDGTAHGGASLDGPQAPPQPAVVPIDVNFNTLPAVRSGLSAVYVPDRNQALLIGGYYASDVYVMDAGTGETTALASLPNMLGYAAAAYVPGNDTAYVFGGRVMLTMYSQSIQAIDPDTGYTRTLSATLKVNRSRSAAVYHPTLNQVYVIGGGTYNSLYGSYDALRSSLVFDPISETIQTTASALWLPQARYGLAAAYSSVTNKVYVFGGRDSADAATDTIYEMTIAPSGETGAVMTMTVSLPQPSYGLSAVEDPHTQLIYLLGGSDAERVLVFDPVTGELWETPVEVEERTYAGAIYSPLNRHALLIGGADATGFSQNNVWRIPLGDGPAVPLGRWDFPILPTGGGISAIDGDEDRVLVGTRTDGVWRYDEDRSRLHYTPAALGSASGNVQDVRYDAENQWVWIATDDAGAQLFDGSSDNLIPWETYGSSRLGTNDVRAVDTKPGATLVGGAPFFGTYGEGLKWQSRGDGGWDWETSFTGANIWDVVHRGSGDLWVVSSNGNLSRLVYNQTTGAATETGYGIPCTYYGSRSLVFGHNDDWWLAAREDEFTLGGVCFIPGATTPGSGTPMHPQDPVGGRAAHIDLDADGRVWVAFEDDNREQSGGLVAWETEDSSPTLLRTEEYNWDDGPVGGNISDTYGTSPVWESGITAVGAVDEKVWAGTRYQELATLAQRWQQLDESNNLSTIGRIRRLWTVRGRLFLASAVNLYVLMPDGKSWDNRGLVPTYAVLGDSRGRIWVGVSGGVRRYTATGWDTLTDTEGTHPTGTVYALAEDADGRIWIGGTGGLTLFDRERFVTTFTSGNSDLPTDTVKALLVDRNNRLWVGTAAGLVRLDDDDSPWVVYTTADGLAGDAIHDLAQLGDGQIAASNDGGLSIYREDLDSFWTANPPIDATNAPLTVDEMGRLWAGSAVWTAGGWQGYYWTNSGLRYTDVSANAADGADRVWFGHGTNPGVSVRGAYLPPLSDSVPVITDISPRHGTSGDGITIIGGGFGDNPSDVSVTIGGARAEVVSVNNTTIVAALNDDNVSGDVSVTVDGRRTFEPGFCAIPQIRAFSPTGGNAGVTVHIEGSNFDPDVQVFVGGASSAHSAVRRRPTQIYFIIQPEDGNGTVRVENSCGDAATSTEEFRHIWLNLSSDHVFFNQGIPSYPLIARRPTWVRYYLTHSQAPRDTDVMEVVEVEITFTNPDSGDSRTYRIPHAGTFTTTLDAPPAAWLQDTSTSLNVTLTPYGLHDLLPDGGTDLEMSTVLKGGYGSVVAQASRTIHFRPNQPLRALLVPIMPTGSTQTDTLTMTNYVNSALGNLRRRIMPTGDVELWWSHIVLTEDSPFDLGDDEKLSEVVQVLQEVRSSWNFGPGVVAGGDALIAFGIVHGDLTVPGSAGGAAYMVDETRALNSLTLDWDCLQDCDFLDWDCLLACPFPLYVGWGMGDHSQMSEMLAHEFGHMLGLVHEWHANGSETDNPGHSVNDELDGGECSTLTSGGGATYNVDRTLYRQPSVSEPIVNPLTGAQWWPDLSATRTITFTQPTTRVITSEAFIWERAKAIMSYACYRTNNNSFFEPVDLTNMDVEYGLWDISGLSDLSPSFSAANAAPTTPKRQAPQVSRPRAISGQRLHVSGVVSRTAAAGEFNRVKVVGEELALSPNFVTGYWLVQLDGDDNELSRTGIYPLFNLPASNGSSTELDSGSFAATVLRQEGVARIELRQEDTVLDTFSAGSIPPTVTVTSPAGGVYSSGTIPVTWTASDADGDPLRITIEYSATGAAVWTPVAFSEGSGTVDVPVYRLAGGDDARFRVTASDGFNSGSATSTSFQVSDQPPRPYIGQPMAGGTFLEGERVLLSGGADDNQDGSVADANLSWSSDRDGDLGTGSELGFFLSVGDHTLTLEAENSVGLTATASVSVTVVGDYDYDGIPDDEELTDRLNPLTTKDAYSDADGDGLPLVMERRRGLDPESPDSDGDGRDDADEIVAGTDPLVEDDPLPPDELEVFPKSLTFEADLSLDTALPQQLVQVVSREPVTWTLTSDVTWLMTSDASGTTVAGPTILVKAFDLEEGVHTGNLNFTSVSLGSVVTVPVTATITNAGAYFDVSGDGCLNVGDVQDVAGRIPSDNSQEGFDYHRDVNRDGEIDVADAQLMAQRWTTERDICSTSYPTATSVVRVSAPVSVAVGTVFAASILVDNPQDVGGFEFDLAFDPSVLQVQGAALGDLLGSTGRTAGDLGPIIDNTAGTIAFGGYTYGEAAGVSSDGELAQITFRATAPGNSTLDIQNPLLANPSGDLTMAADQDASVGATGGFEVYLPLVLRNFP